MTGLSKEDQFGLIVTAVIHVVLIAFAIWYTVDVTAETRPAFIEVTMGQFRSGTPAEFAKEKKKQVATRPDPSDVEAEKPKQQPTEQEEPEKATTEETTKPVDAPDQKEDVQEEPVKTPKTDKVEPEKKTAKKEEKEVTVPPKSQKDETVQKGAENSGDEKGNKGELEADQGTGNDQKKSAPYELKWEGDIERAPVVQPLPSNTADVEAVITVKFEVKPDGSVGRIIPLKKMNPELERQVMKTLKSWRFSRLPSGVPQESQWGTLTFRFVLD